MCAIFLHSVLHIILTAEKSLDYDIIGSWPKEIHIDTDLLQMSAESAKWPFVAEIVLFAILIFDELIVFLVDGIICQMHVLVIFIYFWGVSFTCKSGKALLENVDS